MKTPRHVSVWNETRTVRITVEPCGERPGWGLVTAYSSPLEAMLICREAAVIFDLSLHPAHPRTEDLIEDVLRRLGSVVDYPLVLDVVEQARALRSAA